MVGVMVMVPSAAPEQLVATVLLVPLNEPPTEIIIFVSVPEQPAPEVNVTEYVPAAKPVNMLLAGV